MAAAAFPYDVDAPLSRQEAERTGKYYAEAYRLTNDRGRRSSDYDTRYVQVAESAAESHDIKRKVEAFVDRFGLRRRPILEIGSGSGYLQDVAENYTGLDISPNVARFYHKKFVLASATAMPFPDNAFDGAWSIWVLEHVPNPEEALRECRRVVRDGGVLFLQPAWNCTSWAADGLDVRSYSSLTLSQKLIKLSIPIRASTAYKAVARLPVRSIRRVAGQFGGPTVLHYTKLVPNYQEYWESDSDAVNGLDRHEVMLWFRSRGDECLNCTGAAGSVFMRGELALIIRVHKRS